MYFKNKNAPAFTSQGVAVYHCCSPIQSQAQTATYSFVYSSYSFINFTILPHVFTM